MYNGLAVTCEAHEFRATYSPLLAASFQISFRLTKQNQISDQMPPNLTAQATTDTTPSIAAMKQRNERQTIHTDVGATPTNNTKPVLSSTNCFPLTSPLK
jgi:hypothetical protein